MTTYVDTDDDSYEGISSPSSDSEDAVYKENHFDLFLDHTPFDPIAKEYSTGCVQLLAFQPISEIIIPTLSPALMRGKFGFKMSKSGNHLVRATLAFNGVCELPSNSKQFNLIWSNTHLKPHEFNTLTLFQKINHFPSSFELTRKDRLCFNINRMQQSKGGSQFNFIPITFHLPSEFSAFYSEWTRTRGLFIMKPVASSQGKGIFLISNPNQVCYTYIKKIYH